MPSSAVPPHDEDAIRRALREARADEPMPEEVVARLDRVMADLGADRADTPALVPGALVGSTGDELAARRRRRRVGGLLAAAAVVVVAGLGIGRLPDLGSSHSDSADSGAAGAPEAASGESGRTADGDTGGRRTGPGGSAAQAPEAADQAQAQADGGSGPTSTDTSPKDGITAVRGDAPTVSLSADRFAGQVRRLRELGFVPSGLLGTMDRDGGEAGWSTRDARSLARWSQECMPAAWGRGRLVAVWYAASPAVLAYRPPTGDSQVVELLQCGTGDVLRSTTISLP